MEYFTSNNWEFESSSLLNHTFGGVKIDEYELKAEILIIVSWTLNKSLIHYLTYIIRG